MGEKFGYSINSKGYKVLPDCVRVIQGDCIWLESIRTILESLEAKGWSAENIAFGMGGALLQQPTRDTMSWAMKCSAIMIDGEWHDVYKDPITDSGKRSKAGRQGLVYECGVGACGYRTSRVEHIPEGRDLLVTKFENGEMINTITFDQVRANSVK